MLQSVPLHPVDSALAHLTSARTSYLSSLRRAARLLSGDRADPYALPWAQLRYTHLLALRQACLTLALAPQTINHMMAAVHLVLQECYRAGTLSADDLRRVEDVPRVKGRTLPAGRMLELSELRALEHSCRRNGIMGARDLAALALLYGAALRESEACGVQREDLAPDLSVVRILGKWRREAWQPIARRIRPWLRPWLALRGDAAGPLLFGVYVPGVIQRHRPLSASGLWQMVLRRAARSGVARFSPHDLRRSAASHLLDQGVPLREVQAFMRHAQVTTTQRYDRRPLRDLDRWAARLPL